MSTSLKPHIYKKEQVSQIRTETDKGRNEHIGFLCLGFTALVNLNPWSSHWCSSYLQGMPSLRSHEVSYPSLLEDGFLKLRPHFFTRKPPKPSPLFLHLSPNTLRFPNLAPGQWQRPGEQECEMSAVGHAWKASVPTQLLPGQKGSCKPSVHRRISR